MQNGYIVLDEQEILDQYDRMQQEMGFNVNTNDINLLYTNIFESDLLKSLMCEHDNLGNAFTIARSIDKYREDHLFMR